MEFHAKIRFGQSECPPFDHGYWKCDITTSTNLCRCFEAKTLPSLLDMVAQFITEKNGGEKQHETTIRNGHCGDRAGGSCGMEHAKAASVTTEAGRHQAGGTAEGKTTAQTGQTRSA